MKVATIVLFVLLFFTPKCFPLIQGELIVRNESFEDDIKVEIYPVGAIFRGDLAYNLVSLDFNITTYPFYIVGGYKELPKRVSGNGEQILLDHDGSLDGGSDDGAIGYGKYRIDFYRWEEDPINGWEYVFPILKQVYLKIQSMKN